MESALRKIEESSMDRYKVVSRINDVSWGKPGDIIFIYDGEKFTVRDLDEILEIFTELKYGPGPFYRMTEDDKIIASIRLLREMLQFKEAAAEGIESDPEFLRRWELIKRSILSGAYKYRKFSNEIVLTRNDIMSEYKMLKDSGVSAPLSQVENRLREELFKKALLSLKSEWDSKILNESGFIINDKVLIRQ